MPRTRLQRLSTVNGTELHILAKEDWGSLIFTPVWLAFWTFGGIMVMKWLIHPGPSTPRAFLSLWLSFCCWQKRGLFMGGYGLRLGRRWSQ
jgi:hypothetical protein